MIVSSNKRSHFLIHLQLKPTTSRWVEYLVALTSIWLMFVRVAVPLDYFSRLFRTIDSGNATGKLWSREK